VGECALLETAGAMMRWPPVVSLEMLAM